MRQKETRKQKSPRVAALDVPIGRLGVEAGVPLAPVAAGVEGDVRAARTKLAPEQGEEAGGAATEVATLDDRERLRQRERRKREHGAEGPPVAAEHVRLALHTPRVALHQRVGRNASRDALVQPGRAGCHEGLWRVVAHIERARGTGVAHLTD